MSRPKGTGRRILPPEFDGRVSFSIPEAGKMCGLSRGSSYAAAKAGHLPVVWIGRRGIVPRAALEAMLDVVPVTRSASEAA
jgi:hypothetical protein